MRVLIMGAAGRDFHLFNTVFRGDPETRVVAFTAAQIPDIDGRRYPTQLAGPAYPQGIPIESEARLPELVRDLRVDRVYFAYSDVSYDYIAGREQVVREAGAEFRLMPVDEQMLPSRRKVVAVCAVRTGCGKSQTSRRVQEILRARGRPAAVVRHPMPYGDLVRQRVQVFRSMADLDAQDCSIEEREEYEPHLELGSTVYAGVDYAEVLAEAERDFEVLLWDGGNNDLPFFRPDLHIVVADPHRAGHERWYFPGRLNFERADVIVINKVDTAPEGGVEAVEASARELNPGAVVIRAASPISVDEPELIRGRRVLVVEDGPTLTHGGMRYGAGVIAARRYEAAEIVDPRDRVVGTVAATLRNYPDLGPVLPALGYGRRQVADLEESIRRVDADTVVIATPIDLTRLVRIDRPCVRVHYRLQELGEPTLEDLLRDF